MRVAMLSTNRDFFRGDYELIRIDAKFVSNGSAGLVGFATQQIPHLLTVQATRFLERFDRAVAFAQERLDVLAMKLSSLHGT